MNCSDRELTHILRCIYHLKVHTKDLNAQGRNLYGPLIWIDEEHLAFY